MIAIIGKTSQIGRALAKQLPDCRQYGHSEIREIFLDKPAIVINACGPGSPNSIKNAGASLLFINNIIDDQIIEYLDKTNAKYINISSGAVHGTDKIYYKTSKRVLEYKHRQLQHLKIIDIRVYSFLSEFIDFDSDFFLAKIFKAIITGSEFKVFKNEIFRDYIGAEDLAQMILGCPDDNCAYEAHSKESVSSNEIIEYFKTKGLMAKIDKTVQVSKNDAYFPKVDGYDWYAPQYSSMELIKSISEKTL